MLRFLMGNENCIDAVIPARGGSKGIKNKNLQLIDGIPLVGRAIITAKTCTYIKDVYVSSDSLEILEVAEAYGAKPHMRSAYAARDEASTEDFLNDFLDSYYTKDRPPFFAYLQPTSPFTSSAELDAAIDLIRQRPEISTVFSAKAFHSFIWRNDKNKFTSIGVNHDHTKQRQRRQELEYEELLEDGAFYVLRLKNYFKTNSRFGDYPFAFKSNVAPFPEIDDPNDLKICQLISQNFRNEFTANTPVIKLFVSDFDGVMTDDYVYVDMQGKEEVRVSRADGMAINILKEASIETVVISTEENPVVRVRCEKLGISYFQGVEDKLLKLKELCKNKGVSLENVAYVGNDVNDLSCLNAVGLPLIVNDAAMDLLKHGFYQLPAKGGRKVLRVIAEILAKR